jgi:hypothetical protein
VAETCIACSGKPVATVVDGVHHKPVCETHERLYGDKGMTTYRK